MPGCNCQDVVLLAHGELTGGRKLMASYHVARCPSCRHKFRRHAAVATMLGRSAAAIGLGHESDIPTIPRITKFVVGGVLGGALLVTGIRYALNRAPDPAPKPVWDKKVRAFGGKRIRGVPSLTDVGKRAVSNSACPPQNTQSTSSP